MQNKAKQNYPIQSSLDTRPGNEMGLFYNALEPIRGCVYKAHSKQR